MDYKKKYEEAMLRMNKWVEGSEIIDPKEVAEYIFPELKKSEDKRIRKALIHYFSEQDGILTAINGSVSVGDVIAWLEKQGEQKPTDKIEPKFKVGDWVTNGIDFTFKVMSIKDDMYYRDDNYFIDIKTADKTFRLWTIQDAKDGDVLTTKDAVFIFSRMDKIGLSLCRSYCEVIGNSILGLGFDFPIQTVHPATKEQRDLLFQKMKEAGYEWNVEKKELKMAESVQPELPNGEDYGIDSLYHAERILEKTLGEVEGYQSDDGILEHKCAIEAVKRLYKQKPTWSEEDEKHLFGCIAYFSGIVTSSPYYKDFLWLKSLKERIKGE